MCYNRAVSCFTASIQADPTYVRAYVCRAEAYQQMDKVHLTSLEIVRHCLDMIGHICLCAQFLSSTIMSLLSVFNTKSL